MKLKTTFLAGFLAASLLLTGCDGLSKKAVTVPKPDDSILNAFQTSIVDQNNDFGFQVYQGLGSDAENRMISPVSIGMALDMTYNGANGDTKTAMADALKIPGVELAALNKNNLALLYFLSTADPKVTLDIANSLWLQKDFKFSTDYIGIVKDFYRAAAEELDFSNPKSADTINKWVKDNTQGMIEAIVEPPINPQTILFIINAVYFKGEWTHPFNKDLTTDQTFYAQGGETVTVPMMYQSGSFDYLKGQGFQALRLPYGDEERMAMVVFLPDEDSSLEQFQTQLTAANWRTWLPQFENKQGSLMLPRFTMEYEKSLNQVLTDLGMGVAFEPGKADFSGMMAADSNQDVYISDVKHKTFIQVDEVGTEAAAVTSVEISVTSMPQNDFDLNFNRPFFYAIQDRDTGAILFMGSVLNPAK